MHIQGLRFRGRQIRHFTHCKKWGGSFAPLLLNFSLESFCKFLHQLIQVDFIFSLCKSRVLGLRYGKYIVSFIEWGVSFAPLLLSFSFEIFCKFLQVFISICSGGFYILPLAFNFQHLCYCLIVFASSYINLLTCDFQHWCYLRTLH